jgi:predicted metal-dependent phosphoesterase TrpH
VIDLHTHTTASDGQCHPADLVQWAAAARITVLGITDHDTTAGVAAAVRASAAYGLTVVPGIEVTAVLDARDVHVLGYFVEPDSAPLASFLADQRADRLRRGRAIGDKLAALGCPIDVDALMATVPPGKALARPHIAAALVRAGHVASVREAFEHLIAEGRPAYVGRQGASPSEVVSVIRRAGGLASLAHPGLLGRDDIIPALAADGLDALEAYHSDHDAEAEKRYLELARKLDLVVTGGSDFHGDESHRHASLGGVTLPEAEYARLCARAGRCPSPLS